jgi:hypothetical protein
MNQAPTRKTIGNGKNIGNGASRKWGQAPFFKNQMKKMGTMKKIVGNEARPYFFHFLPHFL